MPQSAPAPFEIFRTGTHTAMSGSTLSFSAADLSKIAAGYDPVRHEAPIVIGHPTTDGPAHGWIKGIKVEGDRLVAEPDQINPAFAELVRNGSYKKVSASFWPPRHPNNPTPGSFALRHVGFLGAVPPAVKDLRQVSFSDAADTEIFEVELQFSEANPKGDQMPDPAQAAAEQRAAELAERERNLAAQEAALSAQTAAFAEEQRAHRQAADGIVIDKLVADGKLLPREKAEVTALVSFLDSAEQGIIEFADAAGGTVKKPVKAALLDMLGSRPALVDYAERGKDAADATDLTDPRAIARAAHDLQKREADAGRSISYAEAVGTVTKCKTY